MGIYLNPGADLFKRAVNSQIYVDKTGLIELTNELIDSEQGFVCVCRPRRFGKSMAANMLAAYYSKDEDFSDKRKKICECFERLSWRGLTGRNQL